jgi:glycosyltransferase involved in cell wall biosynthesis
MGAKQSYEKVRRKPDVTVIVVVYNMPREAPRTLYSLSAAYQRHIESDDYEVIVIDNGSVPPIDRQMIESLSGNFRLIRVDDALPSPAQAINRGLKEARGDIIGVMIDGARIVTPGLLHFARHGARLYEKAVVATLGWYLGPDLQWRAIDGGYNQEREDALMKSIDWPTDGYRLFEIGTMDESSVDGWFQPIAESNALFLPRKFWDALGGVDERFDSPAGGLINLDTFNRAVEADDAQLVILLGEATFHQVHGGTNTNSPLPGQQNNWTRWASQYKEIRGRAYQMARARSAPTYIGTLPRPALLRFSRSVMQPFPRLDPTSGYSFPLEPPLGFNFNKNLWALASPKPSSDPKAAELAGLMHEEFAAERYAAAAAVARLVRERFQDEPEPQRMLFLLAAYSPAPGEANFALALGRAHEILGENKVATSNYQAALGLNSNLVEAHIGLARLRMPGDFYHVWLDRFYSTLAPANVVEIGVDKGQSLSRVCAPTTAIGVDPYPDISFPLKTESHIFPETSDEFFARRGLDTLLAGGLLGIGFIDGLHLYEQVLRDFMHLEAYCGPRSVILIHDTVPLDEATQNRKCNTQFHTGDVWKIVLCLKHYRPELDVFTIATPWTGLTVVTGFHVESRLFANSYEEVVSRFVNKPFSDIESNLESELNMVANDWAIVQARLKMRGIL